MQKILNYIHFPNCVSFAWFCLSSLDKLKDKVKKWKFKLCTCCKIWLTLLTLVFLVRETGFTWLTLFFIFRECLNFFEHMCVRKAGWLGWLRVGSKIYICTFRETWLTWLTLIFIIRGSLKFWIYVCRKRWLTSLTKGMLQNLDMYLSWNVVDLVDFDFRSHRRLEILNICVSEKLVD